MTPSIIFALGCILGGVVCFEHGLRVGRRSR